MGQALVVAWLSAIINSGWNIRVCARCTALGNELKKFMIAGLGCDALDDLVSKFDICGPARIYVYNHTPISLVSCQRHISPSACIYYPAVKIWISAQTERNSLQCTIYTSPVPATSSSQSAVHTDLYYASIYTYSSQRAFFFSFSTAFTMPYSVPVTNKTPHFPCSILSLSILAVR